ncbi:hypothetical protein [Natrarchaeobius chitinivorans]|uniref:hypothetical protein n=1 Tax=Natrarchaeobius chitinivorans TaxID=1679083 RepID=UPI0014044560|nr:hypothetical protein [Natrarchaeobius chitinivorans]
MSKSNRAAMHVGCPACGGIVNASVPPGPGIDEESDSNRLQGRETVCRDCGHELELYYY